MIDKAKLMTQATLLRGNLGEDSNSPVDIFSLAQSIEGLTIVFYPLGEKLSGMCIKGSGNNNVIAINSAMTLGRQRFSLAHEFYHLYFDKSMLSVCAKKINSEKEIEQSADMFASYFLMPEAALIKMADRLVQDTADGHITLAGVIRIEQYFGVSHQAAVYRLMHTSYLSQEDGNDFLSVAVRSQASTLGYSTALYSPSPENSQYMTYGNYISQTEQLLSAGVISMGKYEELLLDAFRQDIVYGEYDEAGDLID